MVSLADLSLYENLYCNQEHMKFLGGPMDKDDVRELLKYHIDCNQRGSACVYKILINESNQDSILSSESPLCQDSFRCTENEPYGCVSDTNFLCSVGTVCIWHSIHKSRKITEIGWSVSWPYQNRGIATKAIKMMLDRVRLSHFW